MLLCPRTRSVLVVVMADKFKKGDGSALSFNATASETRHLTPVGVKLAEELNDSYNTEHILHVLHGATTLMDEYSWFNNDALHVGTHVACSA